MADYSNTPINRRKLKSSLNSECDIVENLIIGQSGGPTAVINASLAGVCLELRERKFAGKVLGMQGGIEQYLAGQPALDLAQYNDEQLHRLAHTAAAALGSCRVRLVEKDYDRLFSLFEQHQIRYFIYIGGNGSMNTPLRLEQEAKKRGYNLKCIGIPKTIDNDLYGTDHAPGFPSAARWLVIHTIDSGLDLLSMRGFDHVKIIEVMGRHAGWLAAATLLARSEIGDPPHIVLVPELPFDEKVFLQKVAEVYEQVGCVLVVASEGLRNKEGKFLAELQAGIAIGRDVNGQALLSIGEGVSRYLTNLVIKELGLKARYDKPGTLQRSAACRSAIDLEEALSLGRASAKYLLEGMSGIMPVLKRISNDPYKYAIEPISLSEITGRERVITSEFFKNQELDEAKIKEYLAPLITPTPEIPFRFH
jgi:6-phosphofructokinase 1